MQSSLRLVLPGPEVEGREMTASWRLVYAKVKEMSGYQWKQAEVAQACEQGIHHSVHL